MIMFTHCELSEMRRRLAEDPVGLAASTMLLERLIAQAEYGLDCARLLDEAVHYPAEPYGEAEVLVARLTDGFNEIWNRHRYRDDGGSDSMFPQPSGHPSGHFAGHRAAHPAGSPAPGTAPGFAKR